MIDAEVKELIVNLTNKLEKYIDRHEQRHENMRDQREQCFNHHTAEMNKMNVRMTELETTIRVKAGVVSAWISAVIGISLFVANLLIKFIGK